jgi:hypothetical protein
MRKRDGVNSRKVIEKKPRRLGCVVLGVCCVQLESMRDAEAGEMTKLAGDGAAGGTAAGAQARYMKPLTQEAYERTLRLRVCASCFPFARSLLPRHMQPQAREVGSKIYDAFEQGGRHSRPPETLREDCWGEADLEHALSTLCPGPRSQQSTH